jgi:hypothetical protein
MPRFDEDWDERVDELERELTQERRGAEAWERQVERDQQAYEDRLNAAREERAVVLAVLGDLVAVVEDIPWHAYCAWRAGGGQADADRVNEWQERRDGVSRRAQAVLGASGGGVDGEA